MDGALLFFLPAAAADSLGLIYPLANWPLMSLSPLLIAASSVSETSLPTTANGLATSHRHSKSSSMSEDLHSPHPEREEDGEEDDDEDEDEEEGRGRGRGRRRLQ